MLLTLALGFVTHAQIKFEVNYSYSNFFDVYQDLEQRANGNFVVLNVSMGGFGVESELLEVDAFGTIVNEKLLTDFDIFAGRFQGDFYAEDMAVTSDGGFIITGQEAGNLALIKLSSTYTVQWRYMYEDGGSNFWGTKVMQTSDGGYLVAGNSKNGNILPAKDSAVMYGMKTDASGNILWDRAVYIGSEQIDDELDAVAEVADGYIFGGTFSQTSGTDTTNNMVIFKTNKSTGTVQYVNIYGSGPTNEGINYIKTFSNGDLLLTGYTDVGILYESFGIRTNGSGVIQWGNRYGISFSDVGERVEFTPDGDLLFSGMVIYGVANGSYLINANPTNGAVNWAQDYVSTSSFFGGFQASGIPLTDGSYVMGQMVDGTGFDDFIIKTDTLGNSGCANLVQTPIVTAFSPTRTSPSYVVDAVTAARQASNVYIVDDPFTQNILCCDKSQIEVASYNDTICLGDSVILQIIGGSSYSWSTGSTDSAIVAFPVNDSTFSVTVEVIPTCDTTIFFPITVLNNDASFSYTNDSSICNAGLFLPILNADTGRFTSTPAGLHINDSTGVINIDSSALGTYTIVHEVGYGLCVDTQHFSIEIYSLEDASFAYSNDTFCLMSGMINPTISGTDTGYFYSDSMLSINDSTGFINLDSSSAGIHTVYHVVGAGSCADTNSFALLLIQPGIADFEYVNDTLCISTGTYAMTFLNGGSLGTYSATPVGISISPNGDINTDLSNPGTYTIQNIVGAYPCIDTHTFSVTIHDVGNPSFSYDTSTYCLNGQTIVPTTNTVGTFSTNNTWVNLNTTTGAINLSGSASGTYTIYNTVSDNACSKVDSTSVTLLTVLSADFDYNDSVYCTRDAIEAPQVNNQGGVFSGSNGLVINTATGEIDFFQSGVGTFNITYTLECESITKSITIEACDIIIPEFLSIDGDGVNDKFEIVGIEYFPNNSLTIFNRWGEKLYQKTPYDNSWDGTMENGSKVPAGTYFMIFDYGDTKNKLEPKTGFISIIY